MSKDRKVYSCADCVNSIFNVTIGRHRHVMSAANEVSIGCSSSSNHVKHLRTTYGNDTKKIAKICKEFKPRKQFTQDML